MFGESGVAEELMASREGPISVECRMRAVVFLLVSTHSLFFPFCAFLHHLSPSLLFVKKRPSYCSSTNGGSGSITALISWSGIIMELQG
jgi:hypothetical protein